jgi:hypothetical protein
MERWNDGMMVRCPPGPEGPRPEGALRFRASGLRIGGSPFPIFQRRKVAGASANRYNDLFVVQGGHRR